MECADNVVRILPEVVQMGPMIALDTGLGLVIQPRSEGNDAMELALAWDPTSKYGFLSRMKPERRQRWTEQLAQNLNRMVAEDMDALELVLPREGSS